MRDFEATNRTNSGHVAILGGSAEARDLACRLGAQARIWLPARDRQSGQGASSGNLSDLAGTSRALVIAPHPCDTDALHLGLQVAATTGVPSATISRPAWRPTRQDHWIDLRSPRDAARVIAPGARVLVTLGRPALSDLRALRHAHLFVRQLTDHHEPFPLKHGRFLYGQAPFSVRSEMALMRNFRIDAVLTRNAGGPGGWPKIAAARTLRLPVFMVARPKVAAGPVLTSVEAALNWLETRLWLDA